MFDFIQNIDLKLACELTVSAFGWGFALFQFIKKIIKAKKEKNTEELKVLLTGELIPLMEEAERLLKDGAEREDWVIKKLSLRTHIDFYKYANILNMAKDIIANICKTTKLDINKNIVVEEKEKKVENVQEVGTNGVF